MTFHRCKNCQFWKPAGPFRDGANGSGNVWVNDLGECVQERTKMMARRPDAKRIVPFNGIYIYDTSPFHTGPEFGCVNFIEKK